MAIDYSQLAFAKPEKRVTTKRRKDRAEDVHAQKIRARCVERDGDCRFAGKVGGVCGGESEWCHLEAKKRARTRGMAPEDRHTTTHSLMGCTTHHRRYDAGEIQIDLLTDRGADGPLGFHTRDHVHTEKPF